MESPPDHVPHLADASKQLAQQVLAICENRLALLLVEVQEERERIWRTFWLSLGIAVFGLLAGVALSVTIAVACWQWSPLAVLITMTALYAGGAGWLYAQLAQVQSGWRSLPATLEQLQKDRECLEKSLH